MDNSAIQNITECDVRSCWKTTLRKFLSEMKKASIHFELKYAWNVGWCSGSSTYGSATDRGTSHALKRCGNVQRVKRKNDEKGWGLIFDAYVKIEVRVIRGRP